MIFNYFNSNASNNSINISSLKNNLHLLKKSKTYKNKNIESYRDNFTKVEEGLNNYEKNDK